LPLEALITGSTLVPVEQRRASLRIGEVDSPDERLRCFDRQAKVEPVISASSGKIEIASHAPRCRARYRALFDIVPERTPSR